MREAALEAACCKLALDLGVTSKKLGGYIVGDPDRVFLLPMQRCWFVEFKTPVGVLSPRQRVVHVEHAAIGHPVSVIRTRKDFLVVLQARLTAARNLV